MQLNSAGFRLNALYWGHRIWPCHLFSDEGLVFLLRFALLDRSVLVDPAFLKGSRFIFVASLHTRTRCDLTMAVREKLSAERTPRHGASRTRYSWHEPLGEPWLRRNVPILSTTSQELSFPESEVQKERESSSALSDDGMHMAW
jgi:hypothetical protein